MVDDSAAILECLSTGGDDQGHDNISDSLLYDSFEVDDGRIDILVLDALIAQITSRLARVGRALPAEVSIDYRHFRMTVVQDGLGCKG